MCQVLCVKLGLLYGAVDLPTERIESALEGRSDGAQGGQRGGEAWAQQAIVSAREEQGDAQTEVGDAITKAVGQALDQTMQAQPAQLVGDGALGD